MNAPEAYRRDIDGLRAVAIVAVVAFHAFPHALPGGFVGVDVFFVISGFLITGIIRRGLEDGVFSFAGFYARRVKRIFPALGVVLAACMAFGYFALLPAEYVQLSRHVVWASGFLSNFALWQETGYFDNDVATKPLLHLWSLGVEEQFYLLWPLLLVVAHRFGRRGALILVGLVAVLSFGANVALAGEHPDAAFFSPLTRFWELLIGSALAISSPRLAPAASRASSIAGVGLIVISAVALDSSQKFPGWLATIPVAGAALIILAGPDALVNRTVLSTRVAVGLGLISYPLYLWHWPLLAFERIILSGPSSRSTRAATVLVALVLAWLTYRWLELAVRNAPRRIAVPLVATLTLLAGCSALVWAADGFPQRSATAATLDNQRQLTRTPSIDAGCIAFVGRKPNFPYCRLSDGDGARMVALIGDSHAHALFAGFAEAAKESGYGVVLLASSSCPPLVGVEIGVTGNERAQCAAGVAEILRLLHDTPAIRDVYIAIRGEAYVDERLQLLHGPGADLHERFRTSLQATVSQLAREGKRVRFIADTPEVSFDPVACIDRPFRPARQHCSPARSDVEAAQRSYRDDIAGVDDMTVVETLPALCDASSCPIVADGLLLYADGHHLSIAGSRRLARAVLAASPPDAAASASPETPTPRR